MKSISWAGNQSAWQLPGRYLVLCTILLLANLMMASAQPAMQISGTMRIHKEGKMGFHIDLLNDSSLEENLGLAGFYGTEELKVSGAGSLAFYDMELLNPEGLRLEKVLSIRNNCTFILGDIHTPRENQEIYLLFGQDAFFVGSSDTSKVDGTIAVMDTQHFLFPVGDEAHLRTLEYFSEVAGNQVKCTYYSQAPLESSGNTGWANNDLSEDLGAVSMQEYWVLDGEAPAKVQLPRRTANGPYQGTPPEHTVVTGWSEAEARWVSLGREDSDPLGDSDKIGSTLFVPNMYDRIAIGYLVAPRAIQQLGNYLLTPNGDGINDAFVLPGNFQIQGNSLEIFDRNGVMVFRLANYIDQFNGTMNTKKYALHTGLGLPEGIYYYLLSTKNPSSLYQGFIYLER